MAGVYTPEQKSFAKALVVATGNTETAIELLRGIWGSEAGDDFTMPSQIPSASSLRNWMHDPRIAVDEALIREWGDRARAKVLATSELIADEMAEALREARARYMAKDGTALDDDAEE